ncbi:hypothetical protein TruAng_010189 [Truncatella angustata]|nr:hypothetical protein TruAng_010189 [Truncatella angustata]
MFDSAAASAGDQQTSETGVGLSSELEAHSKRARAIDNDQSIYRDRNLSGSWSETVIVDWYGPADPDDPKNWSGWKKSIVYFVINYTSLVVYMATSLYAPAQTEVQRVFQTSTFVSSLGFAIYILGYGIRPMIWSPLSEMPAVGRNIPYLGSLLVFVIISVPTALADSVAALIVFRFLQGFFGSPVLSTGAASLSDISREHQKPYALYSWAIFSLAGPSVAMVLAGYTVPLLGWRWSLWEIVLTTSPALVLLLFLPETSETKILYHRASKIRALTGKSHYQSAAEIKAQHSSTTQRFYQSLVIPWKINVLDPSIKFTSVYSGLIYAIFYSFFEFFPLVYGDIYGMDQGQIGLVFCANAIAVILVGFPYFAYVHFVVNACHRKGIRMSPERRLLPVVFASAFLPAGIFLFAWTSRSTIHWIVPTIGAAMTTGGFAILLQSIFVYIALAYPQYAASLFGGNSFVKAVVAFAGVLWSHPLYEKLGWQKGFLCLVPSAPSVLAEYLSCIGVARS